MSQLRLRIRSADQAPHHFIEAQASTRQDFHLFPLLGQDFDYSHTLFITLSSSPEFAEAVVNLVTRLDNQESPLIKSLKQVTNAAGQQIKVNAFLHQGSAVIALGAKGLVMREFPRTVQDNYQRYMNQNSHILLRLSTGEQSRLQQMWQEGQLRQDLTNVNLTVQGTRFIVGQFFKHVCFNGNVVPPLEGLSCMDLDLKYDTVPKYLLDIFKEFVQRPLLKTEGDPVMEEVGRQVSRVRVEHFRPGTGIFRVEGARCAFLR